MSHAKGTIIALLLAFWLLLPLWIVHFPPLLDYPDHLARAFIIFHIDDMSYRFRPFYAVDWGPYPYLGMDVLLAALQHLFSIEIAGRILLSICVISVPIACWWFLRQANPGHDPLVLWTLLLSYNLFFLAGFTNFQLGFALCFLSLGFWLQYLQKPTRLGWLLVLVLLTCTYFMHLLALGIAGIVVLVYSLAARLKFRRLVWSWTLFAPPLIMFFTSQITSYNGRQLVFRTVAEKFSQGRSALLYSYSLPLEIVGFVIIVACLFIAWFRNSEFKCKPAWIVVSCAFVVLYVALPNGVGNAWSVDLRIIPALFVVVLGTARLGRRQYILALIATLMFAAQTASITRSFVSEQFALSEMYRAIEMLPRNTRLFPIINVDIEHDDMPRRLYEHFWAYAVILRGARAPYLFDLPGQTPLRTKTQVYMPDNPDETAPDWALVAKNYDYVWTYNADYYQQELLGVASEVYHSGFLRLFRIERSRSTTEVFSWTRAPVHQPLSAY